MVTRRTASLADEHTRFAGSFDYFTYESDDFSPRWTRRRGYRFLPEHRRQLSVHLAAHKVIYTAGGLRVYDTAVAPVGVSRWGAVERKGVPVNNIWGLCNTSDLLVTRAYDRSTGLWRPDRRLFEESAEQAYPFVVKRFSDPRRNVEGTPPPSYAEFLEGRRHMVRALLCGGLAGHVVDGMTAGYSAIEAIDWYFHPRDKSSHLGDISDALDLSRLLPDGEFEAAAILTEEALRHPVVRELVMTVAGNLEMPDDIPQPRVDMGMIPFARTGAWPPAPNPVVPPTVE
jgi:hypothetical protein